MPNSSAEFNYKSGFLQAHYLPIVLVALYLTIMVFVRGSLRPDQLFLILILASMVLFGGRTGKKFITDWAPFTLFIIIYDGMRGVADNFGTIHVRQPYHIESLLFGFMTNGDVLPFVLQVFRNTHNGTIIIKFLDAISGALYSIHFLAPFAFGWLLWSVYKNRQEFYFFAYSLTILNILALITFFIYPSAPPWYVWQHHFARPAVGIINYNNAATLVNVDALLQYPLFESVYEAINPNAFAAIPSLHGAYPLLITCFAFRRWKNYLVRSVFVIYTLTTWFAACYLNHHYIIDLLTGAAYVAIAILLYKYVFGPLVMKPLVFGKNPGMSNLNFDQIKHPIFATTLFILGGFAFLGLIIFYAIQNT